MGCVTSPSCTHAEGVQHVPTPLKEGMKSSTLCRLGCTSLNYQFSHLEAPLLLKIGLADSHAFETTF